MSETRTIELQSVLSAEVYERLLIEAERQNTPLTVLVREAVEAYLDDLDESTEDMPDENIEVDFRQA